jgi:putative membrane protein
MMSAATLIVSPLALHMVLHILLMNAAAPLAALLVLRSLARPYGSSGRGVAAATLVQIALLWSWHAPSVLEGALGSVPLHVIMHLSLFVAATVFWFSVLSHRSADLWRAILALLLTSKLYCLLGVLLLFAPVQLYSAIDLHHGQQLGTLDDQQAAGLLMLLACPPTYVMAGVIMAARWVCEMVNSDVLDRASETKSLAACRGS